MSCGLCIGHTSFLFINWGLINDIIIIKLSQFIMAIVHYHFPNTSFTWFPPHICCTAFNGVDFDRCLLATFHPIGECISGVDVDDLVSMAP